MKTPSICVLLCAFNYLARAGEHVTLIGGAVNFQPTASETITLEKGDVAELKYAYDAVNSTAGATAPSVNVRVVSGNANFYINAIGTGVTGHDRPTRPIKIAGPATIQIPLMSGGPYLATWEVSRTGTASGPVPIPAEAGTTWQVILEASSDLVNWTAVQPGDYPSSTPQRYFRTRLVKRP